MNKKMYPDECPAVRVIDRSCYDGVIGEASLSPDFPCYIEVRVRYGAYDTNNPEHTFLLFYPRELEPLTPSAKLLLETLD